MAKFIETVQADPEFVIKLTSDEVRFLAWVYDEIRILTEQRYTDFAKKMIESIYASFDILDGNTPMYDDPSQYLNIKDL